MERDVLVMDPVQLDLYYHRRHAAASRGRKVRMDERLRYRGFGENRRREAKLDLLRVLEKVGVTEGKRRALGLFCLNSGLSMKRAEEYLDELVAAGMVQVEGNEIVIPGKEQPAEVKE